MSNFRFDVSQALDSAEAVANTAMFGEELDEDYSPDEVADIIRRIRLAKKFLGDAERQLEERLANAMTTKVSARGDFEKRWSPGKTVWDHEPIAARVAKAALEERLVNTTTGEIESDAEAVARVMLLCAGVGYWRTGALRERDIDPDAWREKQGGRFVIRFLDDQQPREVLGEGGQDG